MYTYRAFVLGNLIKNPKRRFTADEFFDKQIREGFIGKAQTHPFWWCAMNPYFKNVAIRVQSIFGGWGKNKTQRGILKKQELWVQITALIAVNQSASWI